MEHLPHYDSWKTTPPGMDFPSGAEDLMGERVVIGQNQHGLGRWGTIVGFEVEVDEDEDGRGQTVYLEVKFDDGETPRYDSISQSEAEDQLRPPRAARR